MKKLLCILLCCVIVTATFASCEKGDGIPFLTTKSSTTTVKNTVTVTFPEGFTILQIAQRLEENGVCSKDAFLKVCNEPYEGIEIDNPEERIFLLEGYVFADTYEFYLNSDAKSVLKKFIDNFNKKVTPEIREKAENLGYTLDEMLTLASVIQLECDKDIAECANVSSVFHNRLKSSSFSKLQSDVTTFYITKKLGDYIGYKENVRLADQSDEIRRYIDLYSTYYCNDLPAGPICNPSIKAINAAVSPADTDYVYFLTDPSGETFYYASTLAQHNQNGREAGLF